MDAELFVFVSSFATFFFSYLESMKKLEADYRNNLRKVQGDDREVAARDFYK